MKLYAAYRKTDSGLFPCKSMSFIEFVRLHEIKNGKVKLRPVTGGGHNTGKTTTAVGVRFGYEMHDQYIFHFCAMFFSALSPGSIYFKRVFLEIYNVLPRLFKVSDVPVTWGH